MSAMKIKKGDTVKVIAGKDKDKEGKVISVNPKKGAVRLSSLHGQQNPASRLRNSP